MTDTSNRPPPISLDGSQPQTTENGTNHAQPTVQDAKLFIVNLSGTLNIDLITQTKAFELFDKVQQCSTLSALLENNNDRLNYLGCCTVFLASRLVYKQISSDSIEDDIKKHLEKFTLDVVGTPLISLLNYVTIRLVEFFELLNACTSILQFHESSLTTVMKQVQKRFIALDSCYEQLAAFFVQYLEGLDNAKHVIELSWTFFAYMIKSENISDFEHTFNLFAAWLNYLWNNVPTSGKTYGYGADAVFQFLQIKPEELSATATQHVVHMLRSTFNDATFNEILYEQTHLDQLLQKYQSLLQAEDACNDFDARVFLTDLNETVGPVTRMISAPVYQLNPRAGEISSDALSPMRSPKSNVKPKNIVHATIITIQLLNERLKDEEPIPDNELRRFFSGCTVDQSDAITQRLENLVKLVPFDSLTATEGEYRRNLIKKMYYNVLRDMLLGEERRLKEQNFTMLLTNENFHKSHIICSIETILFAYNMRNVVSFPDLLKWFNLQAFELSIIIESFVQHATWFSSAFRRHFRSVEERLLDSLTWVHDSILFTKISETEEKIEPPPPPGSFTPVSKKKQRMFTVYQGEQKPKTHDVAVNYFFRKVYRLVSQRIQELCAQFVDQISRERIEAMWRVVFHVLTTHRELMYDRHLDQIIMCSMYAICKVGKMGISFRCIIGNYRILCEGNRAMSAVEIGKILYKVQLDKAGDTGDIVRFYNQIFIPAVKDFILVNQSSNIPKMPYNQPTNSALTSPQRQRVANNVWVSPMRGSRRGTFPIAPGSSTTMEISNQGGPTMTPRTKELLCFNENFVNKSPNKKNVKRALDFSSDNGPSKKFQRIAESEGKKTEENSSDGEDASQNDSLGSDDEK